MIKQLIPFVLLILLSACKSPEGRYPVSHKSGSFIQESAERNKKLNEKEQSQILRIIQGNPEIAYTASDNGFWYYYNVRIEENLTKPEFGDVVNFNYNIKDLYGNLIYSEDEMQTQNYAMDQEELFSGLREGLKLMKAGESMTFLFPSQKAFGYYGDEDRIGTNVPIMCEVKVNTISKISND